MKKAYYVLTILALAGLLINAVGCDDDDRFVIATTTSLYDTGLWNELEPIFEDEYNVNLEVLYAGTGIALEYGMNGDVEAIAVHSKSRELTFIADGYGMERVPFAYNYFLIVGPSSDPAGIKDMVPEEAFQKLMTNPDSGKLVSRGDDSGTHSKEKAIWSAAGYDYDTEVVDAGSWYMEAGSGMGPTLVKANELDAYTLSDIGTFLAYKGDLDLVSIIDEGSILLNVYSAIACTNARDPEMAENLVNFLVSAKVQELIGDFGVADYGMALFTPCAGNEPAS
ncbi:substrate-binding domain-containing protein [Chloroflexota bacterium]